MLFALMLYIVYQKAKSNETSPAIAIGIVTSLFANLGEIIWIGQKIQRFARNLTEVQDTWKFVSEFGAQTYPVFRDNAGRSR
jgi:hypothetical protein